MDNKTFFNLLPSIEKLDSNDQANCLAALKSLGWYFRPINTAGKVTLYVYVLEEDFDFWNDLFYKVRKETFAETFTCFLKHAKEYFSK